MSLSSPTFPVVRTALIGCGSMARGHLRALLAQPESTQVTVYKQGQYQGKPDSEAYLAKKIKAGGEGVWGPVPMPPQPALKDEEAQAIARWIVGGAK